MDSHKIIRKTCGWDDNACNSIGAWPNSLVWSRAVAKKKYQYQPYTNTEFSEKTSLKTNMQAVGYNGMHTVVWYLWLHSYVFASCGFLSELSQELSIWPTYFFYLSTVNSSPYERYEIQLEFATLLRSQFGLKRFRKWPMSD